MKKVILSVAGLFGSAVSVLFGGWTMALTTLTLFMGVDLISGLICAGVFKASRKTPGGRLSSKAGFKGLAKKCMMMLCVLVGARLDILLGMEYVKDGICIAFTLNELLSIVENAGIMGVPIPKVITDAIELLGSKGKMSDDDKNNA